MRAKSEYIQSVIDLVMNMGADTARKHPDSSHQAFRVLSLNGGGVRALFQAHFLSFLSKIPEIGRFWDNFDLIIGTSAGAIVAAGLAVGKTPEEIANLFENVGKDAFPKPLWNGLRITLRLAQSGKSFSSAPLKNLLTDVYGAKSCLGDFTKPTLAITATEIENSSIRVFSPITKSADQSLKLVDVVMASAALPGVFSDYAIHDPELERPRHYIDGCLWGNAPLLAATALALKNAHASLSNLRVVSIGTAGHPYTTSSPRYRKLTVNSAPFYHCLFNMAATTAERVSFAVVDCLLDQNHVLHVDGLLDQRIKAWEINAARRELPQLAQHCAKDPAIVAKLRRLIA